MAAGGPGPVLAERRAYRRVASSLDVLWNGKSHDNYARATNISLGGCYIETAGRNSAHHALIIRRFLFAQIRPVAARKVKA